MQFGFLWELGEKSLQRLFRQVILCVEPVGRKLFYVCLCKSTWFRFTQPLRQIQQRLQGQNSTALSHLHVGKWNYPHWCKYPKQYKMSHPPHSSPFQHHPHPDPGWLQGPLRLEAQEALTCAYAKEKVVGRFSLGSRECQCCWLMLEFLYLWLKLN